MCTWNTACIWWLAAGSRHSRGRNHSLDRFFGDIYPLVHRTALINETQHGRHARPFRLAADALDEALRLTIDPGDPWTSPLAASSIRVQTMAALGGYSSISFLHESSRLALQPSLRWHSASLPDLDVQCHRAAHCPPPSAIMHPQH